MERFNLLGVEVDKVSMLDLHLSIAEAVKDNSRWVIANHNLHSIYLFHRNPKMREFYKMSKVIFMDGMPLVYWGRFLGHPFINENRITYVDWIQPLMKEASKNGWRIFYLGGKSEVSEKAAKIFREQYPNLCIRVNHGFFSLDSDVNLDRLEEIKSFQPHILLVGMGMPRQENWILDNFEYISANVILTAGACFDYVAGAIPTPPRWMGSLGLEWFFRLITEPRRLWQRYLIEPWFLLSLVWRDTNHKLKNYFISK